MYAIAKKLYIPADPSTTTFTLGDAQITIEVKKGDKFAKAFIHNINDIWDDLVQFLPFNRVITIKYSSDGMSFDY